MDDKPFEGPLSEEASVAEEPTPVDADVGIELPDDVAREDELPRKPKRQSRHGGKPKQSERDQLERERLPGTEKKDEIPSKPPAAEAGVAEEERRAEVRTREERLRGKLEAVDVQREAYEAAKDKLVRKVRELRIRVRRREPVGEELQRETERMVLSFKETEAGRVLGKLLPDRAGTATLSNKLRRIVEMALDLPYWSEPGFNQRYRKKFGSEIVEDFDEQERSIMNDLLDATVEEEAETDTA